MTFKTYEINVDLVNDASTTNTIRFSQNDRNSAKLLLSITNKGTELDLSQAKAVRMTFKKSDGTRVFQNDCQPINVLKGKYQILLKTQTLTSIGNVIAQIHIEEEDRTIDTQKFLFVVNESLSGDEAIESTNEFGSIQKIIEAGEKLEGVDIQAIVDSKETAEQAKAAAAQNANQIGILSQKDIKRVTLPSDKLSKVKRKIPFPEKFTWKDAPINIYKDAIGKITTDFDAATFKPDVTGKKTYYVSLTGNDTNDGLTPQTALKNVFIARAKADVGIIEIAAGMYEDQSGFNNSSGATNSKDIIIRATQGANVVLAAGRFNLTWTKTAGKTNVYQINRSSVAGVYDLKFVDEHGDHKQLAVKTSVDEVDSNPGSYYTDGTVLYVHTVDSRAADQLFVALDLYNFKTVGNYKVYLENLKFWGGKEGGVSASLSASTDTPIIAAKNCEFKYSTNGAGGFMTLGVTSYAQNCVCAWNSRDGFNYHKGGTVVAKAIEVNCIGRSSGIGRGTDQDNGSTMHDGGKAIRVNCIYHSNEGPNVHDITVECESYGSKAKAIARRTNYRVEDNAKMWLDSCIGFDSDSSLYGSTTCEIYLRNSAFDRDDTILGLLEYY
ncbi:BppU family phage baseplate upper protein [Bacillus sp. C30]|uniref:BppU family phage baseplate upper protein n=1 Tax=Bacillus sp. C30 TaxID=1387733 RepID=UPI00349FBB88